MAGGGGGAPIARPIGVMMLMMLPLGALAKVTGMNQMCAAMFVGIIFGSFNLDEEGTDTALPDEVIYAFIELGNALVMFFAGLADSEFGIISVYGAVACLKLGMSNLVLTTGLFAGIGYGSGLCSSSASTIFFGVACSLNSKKVIVNFLEKTGASLSMHGRLLQGLSFFQDMVMLVAITVLYALKRNIILPPDHVLEAACAAGSCRNGTLDRMSRRNGTAPGMSTPMMHTLDINYSQLPAGVVHAGDTASTEVLRAFGIFAVMSVVMISLNRFRLLERGFDLFAGDGEMLFIGTMSYGLGTYALCYQLGISPMTGAYLAGLSLSQLPYQVQIETKISSLQTFGMTLFYFMLGCYVKLSAAFFRNSFAITVLVTLVNVTATPIFVGITGWEVGLKSRTTLYTALLSNSLGESSLTLMVLAFQAGVFDRRVFDVLVCATLGTILICGATHPFLGGIYARVRPLLQAWMDQSSVRELEREGKMPFEHHVVILGFDETGGATADFFRMTNRDVYVVDIDMPLHETLVAGYKGTMPRPPPRVTSRTSIYGAEYLVPANSHASTLGVPMSVRIRLPTFTQTLSPESAAQSADTDNADGGSGARDGSSLPAHPESAGAVPSRGHVLQPHALFAGARAASESVSGGAENAWEVESAEVERGVAFSTT